MSTGTRDAAPADGAAATSAPGATTAPYGAWPSPLPIDLLTAGVVRLGEARLDGDQVYWLEGRPAEAGIQVLVRRAADGSTADISPPGVNVRTRVHEYGGGAYLAAGDLIVFSNFGDGRLYRVTDPATRTAEPITPEAGPGNLRYADLELDRARGRILVVREDHRAPGEAVNTIVAVPLGGGQAGEGEILVEGPDFVSAPRLSPDGRCLAWLSWNHPNMPWDGMDLWVADVRDDGALGAPEHVAGSSTTWTTQPQWSSGGVLYFVDERSGWLNLYRRAGAGGDALDEPIAPTDAEFAWPEWQFGAHTYGFSGDGILAVVRRGGHDELWSIAADGSDHRRVELPWTELGALRVDGDRAVFNASSPTTFSSLVLLDLPTGRPDVLRVASSAHIDPATISLPQPVEFPTANGLTAYGLFYAPGNPGVTGPPGELPPLIVTSHGGPTAAAFGGLSVLTQLFTSRGFAVLDVDYGGSTGYGREYRKRLEGQWGVVDVDDCVNGALAMAERGLVDGERLAIRGGSASGYTSLCAVTFRDEFKAGVSYFGIGDLVSFDTHTHKFESRYTQSLVGPFPATEDRWRERSPLNYADRISCPVLILQGLDDRVVPAVQAEQIVEGLRGNRVPHAYLAFEGEDHGFRKAENIIRSFEAELSFYGQVFGFTPSDDIEPITLVRD